MGLIGGAFARAYLNSRKWPEDDGAAPAAYRGRNKLEVLFGPRVWVELADKTVLDFGCGSGEEAVDIARHGAARVVGIDIRENFLTRAAERARAASVDSICQFDISTRERFDVVLSLDSMEHFGEPARVLEQMAANLAPPGYVLMSFGPPWLHPLGHHFPLFPWAHLVFTERSMMEWRARFKDDGAKTFEQCSGGLNRMTIRKFERLVARSPLTFASLDLAPIRGLRILHNQATREFTTATIRCRLKHR